MSLERIEAEIKKMDLKDRAALAKWILESLDDLSESEKQFSRKYRLKNLGYNL